MTWTLTTIAQSLAAYLAPLLPGTTFYEDPNQQGTKAPCIFLQQRYANTRLYPSGRWLRTIGLDLTCLEDYNLPDLQRRYLRTAELLDEALETWPYTDEQSPAVLVRSQDRSWRIDQDALHYKFEVKAWVEAPVEAAKMETMQLKQGMKEETHES